jgi:glutathione S-transferase
MTDYTLYYWSVPFRGQFVRAALAYAGKTWTEAGDDAIGKLMGGKVADMPVPFMGPPLLVDHKGGGLAIAQMPAVILYLGETLHLLPGAPIARALTIKIVNDANDVIDEMTRDGGKSMWTQASWDGYVPRLKTWMSFWEVTGARHGLSPGSGHMLGGAAPGLADVITATLWTTLADRFPKIGRILDDTAPNTAALCRRISALPPLAQLAAQARQDYGDLWCGGEIETSLRKVVG